MKPQTHDIQTTIQRAGGRPRPRARQGLWFMGVLFLAATSISCDGCDGDSPRYNGQDGGPSDGEVVDDARPAEDARVIESTCSFDNGGCDELVTCTDTDDGPQCGSCPPAYEDDGNGGCGCISTGLWPREPRLDPTETNIALDKSYTLDPDPNYSLCTDPGDTTQLTDGEFTSGYFWTQTTTVGWVRKSPIITIDLGQDRPIKGLSYSTGAGIGAGVPWPLAVFVFVAGPDRAFHQVGNLVTMSERYELPPEGFGVHKFWTNDLHTHGRYVALAVVATPYVFVDEIEVFGGDDSWLDEPIAGPTVDDIEEAVHQGLTRAGMVRRYLYDMHSILQHARDAQASQETIDRILCEWDSALQTIEDITPAEDFKAILPFNGVHRRILSMQAMLWKESGIEDVTVWTANRWDFLPYFETPPQDQESSLSVHLIQGEYRAAQVNITNATSRGKHFWVKTTGLPDEVTADLAVRQVLWTDTSNGQPVTDALPDAPRDGNDWVITAPSGLTSQVWFTFHVTDAEPGSRSGAIELSDGTNTWTVPLTVEVHPSALPAEQHLHLGGLEYVNHLPTYAATEENVDALVSHLKEYFVDRPWATKSALPNGHFDSSGHLTQDPDNTEFDRWVDRWPEADAYGVYLGAKDSFAGFSINTTAFHRAVGEWASFWAAHLESLGLRPDQLLLHVVDEPHSAAQDRIILAWAQAVHDSGSGVQIWVDPTYKNMQDADQSMIAETDILCPNRQIYMSQGEPYAEYFAQRLAAGTNLEVYSCKGPMRLLDPFSYVRMQAWTAWKMQATAMYFWSFVDSGGVSSWNEYPVTRSHPYVPSFIDRTSVTTSKHMEAMREAEEDYEYLFLLKQAIEDAEQRGADATLIQQARDLLDTIPDQVIPAEDASFMWMSSLDRTTAEAARVEILDMIERLAP